MKLHLLVEKAARYEDVVVAVAAAEDEEVIEAIQLALNQNLARFILFGNKEKILELIEKSKSNMVFDERVHIIHTNDYAESVEQAVKTVHSKKANVLMKGIVQTSTLLKAVLNREYGLRTGSILSQLAVFEIPGYDRFIFVTDAGMNISPDLEQKAQIINNAVQIARGIGVKVPLVAPIAAVEVVNPGMQATIDAALLSQMNKRGQIQNCVVDGPLALDNAVSHHAAEQKGVKSDVAGQADILLVPSIEVGNVLYKSLVYFARAKVGSVIAGAKAPIVLTSRADTAESKLYSLALAICSVNQ